MFTIVCCVLQCLSSTTAFGYGSLYVSALELAGVGVQFDLPEDAMLREDHWLFTWCCYMMLIDSAIYGLIGWYISHVFPGEPIGTLLLTPPLIM